jgi:hypothetical protein
MIRQHLSGQPWTKSEYDLQKIVKSFSDLLIQLDEAHLSYTYQVVFHFCQLENNDCLVLWIPNTGTLPFEEWCEEWLDEGEI